MSNNSDRHYTEYRDWTGFDNYTEVVGWLEEHMDGLFHQEADSKRIRFGFDTESDLGFFILTWFELFQKEAKKEDDDPFNMGNFFPSLPSKPKRKAKKKK